jgi:hypothetical protein
MGKVGWKTAGPWEDQDRENNADLRKNPELTEVVRDMVREPIFVPVESELTLKPSATLFIRHS